MTNLYTIHSYTETSLGDSSTSLMSIINTLFFINFYFAPFLGTHSNALKNRESETFQDVHTQTYPQKLWATS
ncbi:protein of unknown function [Acidithiobacillus ferrivorans]|uniref:Uncharacterized protein n=1 Tax=Acidithiobacillus ferrivorans TaxID=160808 RepID=A0A060UW01_9PROT|nr:hypothetical protein AFERRI_430045 [Acidithiobacillus ferrivorans]SMH67407.1 protein of unknown function [Acidithiobacillus ferrivorans]